MNGKELLNAALRNFAELDSYLSMVMSYAYQNTILLCNPVISRNPFSSALLLKVVQHTQYKTTRAVTFALLSSLFKYFLRSFTYFFFFLSCFLTFKLSKLRFHKQTLNEEEPLIVIDTYTLIDKIYPKGKFEDGYFGDLYDILEKRNKQYVVLCFLLGGNPRNLKRRLQTYNILVEDGRNFITEFELMGMREWIELLKFILIYPFVTSRLFNKSFGKFDALFRQELINTLDTEQIFNYVRYLVGCKLGSLTNQRILVISWYENQVISKLLFRGIRESGTDAKIYGCQFFIKPFLWRNLYPLEEEAKHGILPDVILVSGRCYLNEHPTLNIKLGMSPRYNYLFDIHLDENNILNRKGLLILLVYDIIQSQSIIQLIKQVDTNTFTYQISVKLHPNHQLLQPFHYPETWQYTEKHLSTLCFESSLVVTGCSSAAIEAAVMGCSVIIVSNNNGLTLNPMPEEYGQGQIWDLVFDAEELKEAIGRLTRYRQEHPDEIITMANELRDMFFTQATEEKYIELFDL